MVVVEEFGKIGEREKEVPNVLAHDVENWADRILESAQGEDQSPLSAGQGWPTSHRLLWARTVPCANPSCRGEIPLLRSLTICNKPDKKVALTMDVDKKRKSHGLASSRGRPLKITDGTMQNAATAVAPSATNHPGS